MLGEIQFLTIFFRIANLLVLVGLGYYLYRKHFKYRIEEKVNQKEALFKGLEEQGYSLEGRAEHLERQLRHQETLIDQLQEKINEWHQAVELERAKKKQESAVFSQKAIERLLIKNKTVARNHLQNAVIPEALTRAQMELDEKYRDEQTNHAYVQSVLNKLGEAAHE